MSNEIDPIAIALKVKAQKELEAHQAADILPLPTVSRPLEPLDVEMMPSPEDLGIKIAWRAWALDPNAPEDGVPILKSVTHKKGVWLPREYLEATCNKVGGKTKGHVPGSMCSCGLYAAKTRKHLMGMNYSMYVNRNHFRVIGEVKLWGRVIEGTQGWRAQKGYPHKLYVPYEASYLAAPLMKAYGVPVALMNWTRDSRDGVVA